ncbi:hypothetical protein [Virgibacillus ainsalahensis]
MVVVRETKIDGLKDACWQEPAKEKVGKLQEMFGIRQVSIGFEINRGNQGKKKYTK